MPYLEVKMKKLQFLNISLANLPHSLLNDSMRKCPYCFEELTEKPLKCPHCIQYIIDELIESDFQSIEKKKCIFCGKNILMEARICRFCRKWIDEVDSAASDFESRDVD